MTAFVFLIFHIVVCIVVYLLTRLDILRSTPFVVPIVLLVPLWGLLALIILEVRTRLHREASRDLDVDRLLVNDEIHRSILMDEDAGANRVVPLEEALLVNDVSTRRELMMDVLYADPGDYVAQLQEARMNDDTEVVHYAVTALTELQKNYDLEFQRLERRIELDPDDDTALGDAISLSERYLSSGLLEGNARAVQLRSYSDLLARRLAKNPNASAYARKAEADLALGEFTAAGEGIQVLLDQYPQDERGYLLLIRYHAQAKDRAGIDLALGMIRARGVYLSPAGRAQVQFWSHSNDGIQAGTEG